METDATIRNTHQAFFMFICYLIILNEILVSYEQSAITYVWKNDEDTLRKSPSLTTLNAYLIQNQTIPCPIKASWRGNILLYY